MTLLNLWLIPFLARFCLVVMFPFSGYDKIAHWGEAMDQARSAPLPGARWMLVAAIVLEIGAPFCIIFGWHDRLAAFLLAGFCIITAILYHPFWKFPDFWSKDGAGRSHFWDFLKNFGLTGGLLLVVIGGFPLPAQYVANHPLGNMPYTAQPQPGEESKHMPKIPYWHLWTDDDGVSHQTRCELENFEFKGVGNAAPQWNNKQQPSEATVVFTVQPVGWVGEWHENPAPQWIVPISGAWWVEAMDGTRREFGPGELSLGEDQDCKADSQGRKGHRSGTIGDQPAVLMTIQLHVPPVHAPGHLR